MSNLKNLFIRALLALCIVSAAPAALAGPIYRVSLNTATWQGESGYLDLSYGGLIGSATGTAVASNFTGDFDDSAEVYFDNFASGTRATGFTLISSENLAFVSQAVNFGGVFTFDLRFDSLGEGLASDFGVGLSDLDFNALEGFSGFTFTLLPGDDTALPVDPAPGIGGVVAVPEPSDWLLMSTGLALLGFTLRRSAR
ncbi:NF038129 family PEP-CTERM protein [Telluria aromaticivorans]|uniref:PEP-CTERM sorting domain-containing protein n=1 Tax=Telluria aromaticivorans TaxID=2725995 RepID=A0A7Y2P1E6_9BURK|nr:NF038129 family PEP-CTERM protein [Telluria aromaticivorans]NNG23789.1 PEP-CTERM sorting domain-containing protein [Telluria aromaticivorans]